MIEPPLVDPRFMEVDLTKCWISKCSAKPDKYVTLELRKGENYAIGYCAKHADLKKNERYLSNWRDTPDYDDDEEWE